MVKISPSEGSKNLKQDSVTSGQYVVSSIDLYTDADIDEVTVQVPTEDGTGLQEETWYWSAEATTLFTVDEEGNPVLNEDGTLKKASVDFTGGEVNPTVKVSYTKASGEKVSIQNNRQQGFYYVHGDPYTTRVDLTYYNRDATPIADPGEQATDAQQLLYQQLAAHEKAAVTVRTAWDLYFSNYVHMYFDINSIAVEDCTVELADKVVYGVGYEPQPGAALPDGSVSDYAMLPTFAYKNGYSVRPTVEILRCGNTLMEGVDYDIDYDNCSEMTSQEDIDEYYATGDTEGLASYTITGLGNIAGSYTGYFIIDEGIDLASAGFSIDYIAPQPYAYNVDRDELITTKGYETYGIPGGFKILHTAEDGTVTTASDTGNPDAGWMLVEGRDYEVKYATIAALQTRIVYVKGINEYAGTLSRTYEEIPLDLSDPEYAWMRGELGDLGTETVEEDGRTYFVVTRNSAWESTNYSCTLYPIVDRETKIIDTSDDAWCGRVGQAFRFENLETGEVYERDVSSNSHDESSSPVPGKYKVYIQFGGKEGDALQQSLGCVKVNGVWRRCLTGIETCYVIVEKQSLSSADFRISGGDFTYTGERITPHIYGLGATMIDGLALEYGENVEAGTGTFTLTAGPDNPYYLEGTYYGEFSISKFDVTTADITVFDQVYDPRNAAEPAVVVKGEDGTVYQEGRDYTVTYLNNTGKGTATAVITGVGSCEGEQRVWFTIGNTYNMAQAQIAPILDQVLNADGVAEPKVTVTYDGRTLTEGTHYTLSYKNNSAVSSGQIRPTVTVTGVGSYVGSASETFNIVESLDMSLVDIAAISDQAYTGKAVEPAISASYYGVPLVEGQDYTVEYRRNVKAGANAKVVLTGMGSYSGQAELSFRILPGEDETSVERVSANLTDEAAYALETARELHPDAVDGVVVAWQKGRASQALATVLAAAYDYPLLLVSNQSVSTQVTSYIRECGATRALLMGGEDELSASVEETLSDTLGLEVQRVAADAEAALQSLAAASLLASDDGAKVEAGRIVVANPAYPQQAVLAAAAAAQADATLLFTLEDGTLPAEAQILAKTCTDALLVGDAFSIDASVQVLVQSRSTAAATEAVTVMRAGAASDTALSAQVVEWVFERGGLADGAYVLHADASYGMQACSALRAACDGTVLALAAESTAVSAGGDGMQAVAALAQCEAIAFSLKVIGDAQTFSDELCDVVTETMGW